MARVYIRTCECGTCQVCLHRRWMHRQRDGLRRLATEPLAQSPIAIIDGAFAVRSSWDAIEAWCWRQFGPPAATVAADIGMREMSDHPTYRQRRYRATRGRRNLVPRDGGGYRGNRYLTVTQGEKCQNQSAV